MSNRRDKGRLPDFVPLFKSTIQEPAWKALSHGARSLYAELKGRYHTKLQGHVYLSTRDAVEHLGSHSHRDNVRRWFRELDYYGFIRIVSPGCLGVDGKGRAPHWRLTEVPYLSQAPTRDYQHWDGTVFHEQKSPKSYTSKKQNPGPPVRSTVDHPSGPVVDHPFRPVPLPSGPPVQAMQAQGTGPPVQAITSITTHRLAEREAAADWNDIPDFLRRAARMNSPKLPAPEAKKPRLACAGRVGHGQLDFAFAKPIDHDETLTRKVKRGAKQHHCAAESSEVNGLGIRSDAKMIAALPVTHRAELIRLVRRRIAELDVTYESIDNICGFPSRYTSKLLCDPPIRGMSADSMFALLGALGLAALVQSDDVRLAALRQHHEWRPRRRNGPQYMPRPDLKSAAPLSAPVARSSGRRT